MAMALITGPDLVRFFHDIRAGLSHVTAGQYLISRNLMQKMNTAADNAATMTIANAGKPTMPLNGRLPKFERKSSDPSSASKHDRYPIPSFFEYRIKPKDFDPL
jgi:hypothetical protein